MLFLPAIPKSLLILKEFLYTSIIVLHGADTLVFVLYNTVHLNNNNNNNLLYNSVRLYVRSRFGQKILHRTPPNSQGL